MPPSSERASGPAAPVGSWWHTGAAVGLALLAALALRTLPLPPLPEWAGAPTFARASAGALVLAVSFALVAAATDWLARRHETPRASARAAWYVALLLPATAAGELWLVVPFAALLHALVAAERGRAPEAAALGAVGLVGLHAALGLAPWIALAVAWLLTSGVRRPLATLAVLLLPPVALAVAWALGRDTFAFSFADALALTFGRAPALSLPTVSDPRHLLPFLPPVVLLGSAALLRRGSAGVRTLAALAGALALPGLVVARPESLVLLPTLGLAPTLLLAKLPERWYLLEVPVAVALGALWLR